jgi:hypothetical protein
MKQKITANRTHQGSLPYLKEKQSASLEFLKEAINRAASIA